MGLLSLPAMLRRGYDPSLACGSICAAGTLGQIIPPSIVLVVLGDQISNAHQEAQRALGNWAPEPVSVGDLFAGALLPGLVLVGLYIALADRYRAGAAGLVAARCRATRRRRAARCDGILHALVAPIVLIVAVLGSILGGMATPTEAAAVGAIGATLLAGQRFSPGRRAPISPPPRSVVALIDAHRERSICGSARCGDFDRATRSASALAALCAAWRSSGACWSRSASAYRDGTLVEVMRATTRISSMVFVIVIGAQLFSLVFRGFGGDDMVHEFLTALPGGAFGAMVVVMALMFVMGFFLDFIEITFVVVPVVGPVLLQLGLDPIWLGVMMAVNLQTSFLTPPFGFALFYLRGVAPPEVTTLQIYRGVVPFVALQLFMLVLLALFPAMATWLPRVIFG